RGMHRGQEFGGKRGVHQLATIAQNAEFPTKDGLGGGGTETDHNLGPNHRDLRIQPRATSIDFRGPRFFMNAPLAARRAFPAEMFHGIGYVNIVAINAGLRKSVVEDAARRTDKGLALDVLAI